MTGRLVPPSALLCVPGLGLGAEAWAPTLRERTLRDWAGSIQEPALLPAYGVRPAPGDELTPHSLGQRLARRRLSNQEPTVLLGHSASCQIVIHAALAEPTTVAALVLVGPTTDPRARSWPPLAQRWLRTAAHERPGQVPLLVRLYARNGIRQMLRAMDEARREDIRDAIARLACPVLVLRGRHDRICPEDWAHHLRSLSPAGSRVETLPAGGHMVPITHGAHVANAIRRFLG